MTTPNSPTQAPGSPATPGNTPTPSPGSPVAPSSPSGQPAQPSQPGQPSQPSDVPPGANPATLDGPGAQARALHAPDKDSNPATSAGLGGVVAPHEEGVVKTTIDSQTTTINPKSTINNRVDPDGMPVTKEGKRADQEDGKAGAPADKDRGGDRQGKR